MGKWLLPHSFSTTCSMTLPNHSKQLLDLSSGVFIAKGHAIDPILKNLFIVLPLWTALIIDKTHTVVQWYTGVLWGCKTCQICFGTLSWGVHWVT